MFFCVIIVKKSVIENGRLKESNSLLTDCVETEKSLVGITKFQNSNFRFSFFGLINADVAELADALDLGSSVNDVGVQVPSSAPEKSIDFVGAFFN